MEGYCSSAQRSWAVECSLYLQPCRAALIIHAAQLLRELQDHKAGSCIASETIYASQYLAFASASSPRTPRARRCCRRPCRSSAFRRAPAASCRPRLPSPSTGSTSGTSCLLRREGAESKRYRITEETRVATLNFTSIDLFDVQLAEFKWPFWPSALRLLWLHEEQ